MDNATIDRSPLPDCGRIRPAGQGREPTVTVAWHLDRDPFTSRRSRALYSAWAWLHSTCLPTPHVGSAPTLSLPLLVLSMTWKPFGSSSKAIRSTVRELSTIMAVLFGTSLHVFGGDATGSPDSVDSPVPVSY